MEKNMNIVLPSQVVVNKLCLKKHSCTKYVTKHRSQMKAFNGEVHFNNTVILIK